MLVRSPHAHARIVKIDTMAARKAAGVIAVFTWADMAKEGVGDFSFPAMFPNADGSKPEMTPRRSLAHEAVRYVGEAVAAVVAESREQAQDAAELVEVEYDPLPSVSEIEDALKPGAPQVWKEAIGDVVVPWLDYVLLPADTSWTWLTWDSTPSQAPHRDLHSAVVAVLPSLTVQARIQSRP